MPLIAESALQSLRELVNPDLRRAKEESRKFFMAALAAVGRGDGREHELAYYRYFGTYFEDEYATDTRWVICDVMIYASYERYREWIKRMDKYDAYSRR